MIMHLKIVYVRRCVFYVQIMTVIDTLIPVLSEDSVYDKKLGLECTGMFCFADRVMLWKNKEMVFLLSLICLCAYGAQKRCDEESSFLQQTASFVSHKKRPTIQDIHDDRCLNTSDASRSLDVTRRVNSTVSSLLREWQKPQEFLGPIRD